MDVKRGNCQERKEIQGFMVVAQVALNAWGYITSTEYKYIHTRKRRTSQGYPHYE